VREDPVMTDTLELDDVALAYETAGTGDPTLLLVHGFTGAKLDWTDVVGPLSASRRVVVFDHRGHGESTNTGDPASYTFPALGRDLEQFVDAVVGTEPFDLVGHSMGGILSLRYVLDHPDRVRSFVLMDTFSEPSITIPKEYTDGVLKVAREQGMEAVADMISQFVPMPETMPAARAEVIVERLRWKFGHLDPEAFAALAQELGAFPAMTSQLGEIRCPTTVVVGEHDTPLRAAAGTLAAGVPGAVLAVIPDAVHSPQEENTAAWLTAIEVHLAR
jgi:2-succinyl-6-hydroxy-2,4-cyclohexadiene-1-carboxylate synthase